MNKVIRVQCDCGRFFNKNFSDQRQHCDKCDILQIKKTISKYDVKLSDLFIDKKVGNNVSSQD